MLVVQYKPTVCALFDTSARIFTQKVLLRQRDKII